MKLQCPACHSQFSLDAAVANAAARTALQFALNMPAELATPLAQYLGLFRAAGRALSYDRVAKLLGELEPMLRTATVTIGGRTTPASLSLWRACLEQVLQLRDRGALTLPLKSNGYLLAMVGAEAAKVEQVAASKAETKFHAEAQTGVREKRSTAAPETERARGQIMLRAARGELTAEQAACELAQLGKPHE